MGWSSTLVQQRLREAMAVERRPKAERSTVDMLRSQEAMGWLSIVPKTERQHLAAQALAADTGFPIRKMLRARGWPVSTFYRTVSGAASRIAAVLDERGVAVR